MEVHEAAMAAHLAHLAMAATPAACDTPKATIATGHDVSDAITGVEGSTPMHE